MADIVKRVKTIFTTSGLREMRSGAKSTRDGFESLGRSVTSFRRTLLGIGAAIGVSFGVREGLGALVGFNKELETSRIAIAAVLDLNTKIGKDRALEVAAGSMERLRVIAKKNVGEFKDFLTVFQLSQGAVFRAGGTVATAENLARLGVPAGLSLDIDTEQFGRDVNLILSGRAGAQVKTFQALAGAIGLSAEEFNRLGAPERLAKLTESLEAFSPFVKEFERSLDGQLGTLKDNVTDFAGKVGEPLFAKITEQVTSLNVWIEKNADDLERWASIIGDKIVTGFEAVVDAVSFIIDNKDALIGVAKAIGVAFGVSRLTGKSGGGVGKSLVGLGGEGSLTASFGNLAGAASLLAVEFAVLSAAAAALDVVQKGAIDKEAIAGSIVDGLRGVDFGTLTAASLRKTVGFAEGGGEATIRGLAKEREEAKAAIENIGLLGPRALIGLSESTQTFIFSARAAGISFDDIATSIDRAGTAVEKLDAEKLEAAAATILGIAIGIPAKVGLAIALDAIEADKRRRAARRKATPVDIKITVSRDPDRTAVVLSDRLAAEARRRTSAIGALALGL